MMGGMAQATVDGRPLPMREMMGQGLAWALNGIAADESHAHEPLFDAKLGESVILGFVNDTAWPHPMHLHGHVFRLLARKEIAALGASGPTPEELARAKKSWRSGLLDALESPEGKAELLVECWRAHGRADCLAAEAARYEAVTAADVSRVVRSLLVEAEPWSLSNVPRGDAASAMPGSAPVELP